MRVAALLLPVTLLAAEECHVIVREREKAGRGWHSTHFWHLMMADFLPRSRPIAVDRTEYTLGKLACTA